MSPLTESKRVCEITGRPEWSRVFQVDKRGWEEEEAAGASPEAARVSKRSRATFRASSGWGEESRTECERNAWQDSRGLNGGMGLHSGKRSRSMLLAALQELERQRRFSHGHGGESGALT